MDPQRSEAAAQRQQRQQEQAADRHPRRHQSHRPEGRRGDAHEQEARAPDRRQQQQVGEIAALHPRSIRRRQRFCDTRAGRGTPAWRCAGARASAEAARCGRVSPPVGAAKGGRSFAFRRARFAGTGLKR
jgi:hypothetical protein